MSFEYNAESLQLDIDKSILPFNELKSHRNGKSKWNMLTN